jgi:phage terminase small subunit
MKGLTAKQERFVEEYLVDLNATQAAIRAGYSKRTARSVGSENLTKPDIAEAIAEARRRVAGKLEVTKERIVSEYARLAFSDIRDLFTWDEERACYVPSQDLTADQAAAVSAIEAETVHFTDDDGNTTTKIKLKLKTYDKKGALDSLAKHLGMFVDRVEHTGADGGPIETREMTDAELVERAHAQANRLTGLPVARSGNGNGNGRH